MTAFAELSESIAALVAAAAPLLTAVRIGANRHITGVIWQPDLVITSDQGLPAQDSHTLVLPDGVLTAARTVRRHTAANLAALRLEIPTGPVQIGLPEEPRVGALALALAADADATPLARLTAIHKIIGRTEPGERAFTLDMPINLVAEGGPVFDASGGLFGIATVGATNEATVVPAATIARMLEPANVNGRRGWLGVALQPITVPESMRSSVGQASGRMVVSVAPSGPAEHAGLRPGDILLSLDGHSVSGAHALRAFLGPERIGRQVEVRMMRDGLVESRHLTVAPQPVE
jgi:S1-C subfamily serine protease